MLIVTMASCEKADESPFNPANGPSNSSWKATMHDENLATNPPGEFGWLGYNQYYPWLDCHLEMTFSFRKDGKFVISNAGSDCKKDDLIFRLSNGPFTYDEERKLLVIGIGDERLTLEVSELNNERLKLSAPIHTNGGLAYIVFIFKRK